MTSKSLLFGCCVVLCEVFRFNLDPVKLPHAISQNPWSVFFFLVGIRDTVRIIGKISRNFCMYVTIFVDVIYFLCLFWSQNVIIWTKCFFHFVIFGKKFTQFTPSYFTMQLFTPFWAKSGWQKIYVIHHVIYHHHNSWLT